MSTGRSCIGCLALASLTCAGLLLGCNRQRRDYDRLLGEVIQSYERLGPRLNELRSTLASLHQDVEDLAVEVPGGPELRAKYFSADEVMGVLDAKVKWLSGEIASARQRRELAQVLSLRDAIGQTAGDLGQVGKVAVEITHEKARLARIAALHIAPYQYPLHTGYLVKGAKDGVEARLIAVIEQSGTNAAPARELDFDRLELTAEGNTLDLGRSHSQLENVAQILLAYPAVKLKVVACCNRGATTARRKQAEKLADAVRQAVVVMGVSADRLAIAVDRCSRPPAADAPHAPAPLVAALVTAK